MPAPHVHPRVVLRTVLAAVIAGPLVALTAACGVTVPSDPEGTLDRVRGGVLRVGVAGSPPWTELPRGARTVEPAGIEVDLVKRFGAELDADVEWVTGGEAEMIADLADGEVDLVVAGLKADTPWTQKVATTRPYLRLTDEHGRPAEHVMAVPMGENAFLVTLERFLLEQEVTL